MSNDNPLDHLAETAQSTLEEVKETATAAANDVTETAAEAGSSLLDSVMDMFSNAKSAVASAVESLTGVGAASDTAADDGAQTGDQGSGGEDKA